MDERNDNFEFDFMPMGQAIKKARESRGMTREQLAACPADALKTRQTEIFVLRHYLRKRHCPRILQTDITKSKIQQHIVISGIFILFQNSPDFLFNGFKVSHCYLHKRKGGIFQPPKPLTYSFCYGYSAIPPHPQ